MAKQTLTINGVTKPTLRKEDEKAIREFSEAATKVKEELERVKERQAEAKKRTADIQGKLGIGTVDILTVENDKARSDLLGNRKKLKEELEEEELYLHVDLGAYVKRLREQYNLEELQKKALQAETNIYNDVNEYVEALEKYTEEMTEERNDRLGLMEQYTYADTVDDMIRREVISLNKKPEGQSISTTHHGS